MDAAKIQAAVSKEMPRYKCHKEVWALKIAAIQMNEGGGATVTPADEGYAPFVVSDAYLTKHAPEAGGYYVLYQDGYKSWSPALAFEESYTRI